MAFVERVKLLFCELQIGYKKAGTENSMPAMGG